jgi:hypothetical protein
MDMANPIQEALKRGYGNDLTVFPGAWGTFEVWHTHGKKKSRIGLSNMMIG